MNKAMTLEEIKELAEGRIGKDVNYFTCSESSMDTDAMINFLLTRNKLMKVNDGFMINTGSVCNHE
jgi:probable metal-binding protein